MLKSLIFFTLFFNIAFAKDRLSEADKKRFLDEVKQEIAEHKVENKGRVDLQIIKPTFYAELEELLKQEKFTRDEMLKIKQSYENFSRSNMAPDKTEEAFLNFLQQELLAINSKPLEKVREGNICNTWSCADGFKCAPDPVQQASGKFKKAGATCNESNECVSGECLADKPGSKTKICEEVYRCFRPLSLGESCMANPVCGTGSCLPYNSLTSGIGECQAKGNSCKKNSDCCSNSCGNGTCKNNVICKDCISNGSKPQRGQKCCEGLYLNEKGMCAPDVPPSVIPQVYVAPKKTLFLAVQNFLFSTAEAQEDMGAGAKNDGLNITSGVKADRDKYSNFQATSEKGKTLNMEEKKANLTFEKKSDFSTCDIRFKDDFYNALKKDGNFDLEVAMLGFDFVSTGDSDNDYWMSDKTPESSIFGRLKKIGQAHRLVRQDINAKMEDVTKRLTCMCLDVQGFEKISNADKKKFFAEQCEEYSKYANPGTSYDELNGDASGLKYKRLIVVWTEYLANFHETLTVNSTDAYSKLLEVSNWANSEAKWSDARTKSYDLFKFSVKNPSGSVAGLGAIVGALLAAGVIAILGGFATTSILSSWAAAGIITASAATGAGGLWMIASLKGAWITMRPEISDSVIAPRSYSCGKKETCMEYTRTLIQPYNEVCKIHTSSNACLKSFVVINEGSEPTYIIDPWIPAGVSKDAILKGQGIYTDKLERGFEAAKSAMVNKNPGATGGGSKNGGGGFVAESYLSEVFIDENVLGKYLPGIGNGLESTYFLSSDRVKLIKDAAKKFAVDENFLEAGDTANLEAFANYAYEYHFLWPKKSRPGEISYPTVGLTTYLNYISKNVTGTLATSMGNTAKGLLNLHQKHLQDYKNNLAAMSDPVTNQLDAVKNAALSKDLDKVTQQLNNLAAMNTMLGNTTLDSQLGKLTNSFVAEQGKLAGVKGTISLDSGQTSFLKAVGTLRTSRNSQLKSLEEYNKAMASNGDKDRAVKMASTSKSFGDKFSTGKSALGSNGFVFGQSAGSSSGSAKKEGADTKGSAKDGSNGDYGYGLGSGSNYGSGHSGSGSSSSSSAAAGKGADSAAGPLMDSDQSRLADAIDARNQDGKNKYQSNDELTLFQKVTNAYIRNYDKVLSKRKDKDVIEEK